MYLNMPIHGLAKPEWEFLGVITVDVPTETSWTCSSYPIPKRQWGEERERERERERGGEGEGEGDPLT